MSGTSVETGELEELLSMMRMLARSQEEANAETEAKIKRNEEKERVDIELVATALKRKCNVDAAGKEEGLSLREK